MTPAELISSPDVHHNHSGLIFFEVRRRPVAYRAPRAILQSEQIENPGGSLFREATSNDQILRQAAPSRSSRPVYLIDVVNRGVFWLAIGFMYDGILTALTPAGSPNAAFHNKTTGGIMLRLATGSALRWAVFGALVGGGLLYTRQLLHE
jgi:hypothetical protein